MVDAGVVELVDTPGLEPGALSGVRVQVPPPAYEIKIQKLLKIKIIKLYYINISFIPG